MFHFGSIAIGALVGGFGVHYWMKRQQQQNASGNSKLAGRIVAEFATTNPAPQGLSARAGARSRGDFEWAYVTGPGDTAASIAEAITGDDGRYQELLIVNPEIPTVGVPGLYMGDAWDFAALHPNTNLLLPLPWNRFVDEMGHPRGSREPFPLDSRAKPESPVAAAGLPPPANPSAAVAGTPPRYFEEVEEVA